MQLTQMLALAPSDAAHGFNARKGAAALPSTMDAGGLFALLLTQLGGSSSHGEDSLQAMLSALKEQAGLSGDLAGLVEGAPQNGSKDAPLVLLKQFLRNLESEPGSGSDPVLQAQDAGRGLFELAGALEALGQTEDAPAPYDALALDLLKGTLGTGIERTAAQLEKALQQGDPKEAAAILERLAEALEGSAREAEPALPSLLKATARQLGQRTLSLSPEARESLGSLVEEIMEQASSKKAVHGESTPKPGTETGSNAAPAPESLGDRNASKALWNALEGANKDGGKSTSEAKTAVKTLLQFLRPDGEESARPAPELEDLSKALVKVLASAGKDEANASASASQAKDVVSALLQTLKSDGEESARPAPELEDLSKALVKVLASAGKDEANASVSASQAKDVVRALLQTVKADGGNYGAESALALEHDAEAMLKVLSQETKSGDEAEWVLKALQALREQGDKGIESEPEARTSLEALLRKAAELDEQQPPRQPPSAEGWRSASEGEAERPLDQLVEALPREALPLESSESVTSFESSSQATETLAPLEVARPAPKATPSSGGEEAKPPQPPPADVSSDKPTRDLWWAALRPVDTDSAREETRLRQGDSFRLVTREMLSGRKTSPLAHAADSKGAETLAEIKSSLAPFSSKVGQSAQAAPAEGRALFLTPETAVSSKEGASRSNQSGSWNLSTAVQEPAAGVARSEAAASPPGAARTEPPDLQQSVIQSVRYLANRGERSLNIRLKPDSLGELRVTVTTVHDRIQVQLFTGNAAVRDSLEAQLPQLRESLTRDGFDVMRLSVEGNSTGGNAAESGDSRTPMHDLLNQRQGGRSFSSLGPDTGQGSAGSTSPGNTANRITDQTIDVRI